MSARIAACADVWSDLIGDMQRATISSDHRRLAPVSAPFDSAEVTQFS
jgi:hypothetical protein